MVDHPPKPRLTLRVGITGHRPNKLSGPAAGRVREQLPRVFAAIAAAADEILAANVEFYAAEPPALRLVSGFAEGADQMAVAACPADWQVEAILPFPADEYLKDFEQSAAGDGRDVRADFLAIIKRASAVTELAMPRNGVRQQGYIDAAGYLLRQIDVLIAVWDGQPPSPGGTGMLAKNSHENGIPVVWMAATPEPCEPRLIVHFDEGGNPVAPHADCTEGPLGQALKPIFAAPPQSGKSIAGLRRFLGEHWHRRYYFPIYDLLRRLLNGRRPRLIINYPHFEQRLTDWDAFLKESPDTPELRERIRSVLLPRFVWADTLAVHYSHYYRGAYVLAYLLSAAAVIVALMGVTVRHTTDPQATLMLFELLAIGFIMTIVWLGQRLNWHERWLEYRALAEGLRHGRFLAFVSEFGRIHEAASKPGGREKAWMLWYIRATMREIGLPTARMDNIYQWRLLDATLECEIEGDEGQLAYHRSNRDGSHRMDRALHFLATGFIKVSFAVLAVFLASYWVDIALHGHTSQILINIKPWLVFATVSLSSVGAALAAIRVHGDFDGSEERSAHMIELLELVRIDYRNALGRDIGRDETAEILIATARIMSEDLAAWQELYGRKRLTVA